MAEIEAITQAAIIVTRTTVKTLTEVEDLAEYSNRKNTTGNASQRQENQS